MIDAIVPALVLVGGFLGAGKTTLILRAANHLRDQGRRVAIITNDQDQGLVDTMLSRAESFHTREVAGGCFCCRFSDLIEAAEQLAAYRPEIIFAEPVGSCLDISGAILQPLQAFHAGKYRLAPFTVLVDPGLAQTVFAGTADPDVSFLFRGQLEEADIVCFTKRDRYHEFPPLPVPPHLWLSGITGEGITVWLEAVLGGRSSDTRSLDVDYTRYAEAEAALGWVNLHANVRLRRAQSAALVVGPLLDRLDSELTRAGISIAHLKILDQTPSGYVKASIARNNDEPEPQGDLLGERQEEHDIVVNLRALADPDRLRDFVLLALADLDAVVSVSHASAFRPSPPKPQCRVVET